MKKILVIGDAMLDSYHFGEVNRISPEAPVPVFLERGSRKYSPGGAANVAVNLAAIGVPVIFCGMIGKDEYGKILKSKLEEEKIETKYITEKDDYNTITKLRYIGPGNQQLLRVDTEEIIPIDKDSIEEIMYALKDISNEIGLILISDYLKGFLTIETTQAFIEFANENKIPILADVKDKNYQKYKGSYLLKPNRKELAELSGESTDTVDKAICAAKKLCREAGCRYVLATLGADGMILIDNNNFIKRIHSVAREVYDVTGAGDTSLAYLAAELLKGSNIEQAVIAANYAAGVQVSKLGTSIVYPDEVEAAMYKKGCSSAAGFLDSYRDGGLNPIFRARASGKKIVFTNGCFDILHSGHITYLREAKSQGDILVVGVNSDDSVKRLKGDSRPINSITDRMLLLSSLDFVDYVIEFKEDTPLRLIEKITPDVLVKGGDYKLENIVGADYVIAHGGEVRILDFIQGKSTTSIIEKLRER